MKLNYLLLISEIKLDEFNHQRYQLTPHLLSLQHLKILIINNNSLVLRLHLYAIKIWYTKHDFPLVVLLCKWPLWIKLVVFMLPLQLMTRSWTTRIVCLLNKSIRLGRSWLSFSVEFIQVPTVFSLDGWVTAIAVCHPPRHTSYIINKTLEAHH